MALHSVVAPNIETDTNNTKPKIPKEQTCKRNLELGKNEGNEEANKQHMWPENLPSYKSPTKVCRKKKTRKDTC